MESDNPQTLTRFGRPFAALTPRPIRLLLVGRVRPGREPAVREVQTRFPIDAAVEAGIDAVEAYIGSGYYALLFESSSEDIQKTLATFLNDRRTKAFFSGLEPDVEGLPGPAWGVPPGDRFQETSPSAPVSVDPPSALSTAELPLAANMYRWRVGQPPEIGELPHGGAG